MELGVEDRLAFNRHLHDVATQEAIVRSCESRLQVLSSKASQAPDRYGSHLEEANGELDEAMSKLDEMREMTDNWGKDPEGTRNTLSDKFGNFARNTRVANAGGTHIEGSNSIVDSGEPADDPEDAGSDPIVGETVITGHGGRGETLKGKAVQAAEDDDEEGEEKPARRARSTRRSRKARASASADENAEEE